MPLCAFSALLLTVLLLIAGGATPAFAEYQLPCTTSSSTVSVADSEFRLSGCNAAGQITITVAVSRLVVENSTLEGTLGIVTVAPDAFYTLRGVTFLPLASSQVLLMGTAVRLQLEAEDIVMDVNPDTGVMSACLHFANYDVENTTVTVAGVRGDLTGTGTETVRLVLLQGGAWRNSTVAVHDVNIRADTVLNVYLVELNSGTATDTHFLLTNVTAVLNAKYFYSFQLDAASLERCTASFDQFVLSSAITWDSYATTRLVNTFNSPLTNTTINVKRLQYTGTGYFMGIFVATELQHVVYDVSDSVINAVPNPAIPGGPNTMVVLAHLTAKPPGSRGTMSFRVKDTVVYVHGSAWLFYLSVWYAVQVAVEVDGLVFETDPGSSSCNLALASMADGIGGTALTAPWLSMGVRNSTILLQGPSCRVAQVFGTAPVAPSVAICIEQSSSVTVEGSSGVLSAVAVPGSTNLTVEPGSVLRVSASSGATGAYAVDASGGGANQSASVRGPVTVESSGTGTMAVIRAGLATAASIEGSGLAVTGDGDAALVFVANAGAGAGSAVLTNVEGSVTSMNGGAAAVRFDSPTPWAGRLSIHQSTLSVQGIPSALVADGGTAGGEASCTVQCSTMNGAAIASEDVAGFASPSKLTVQGCASGRRGPERQHWLISEWFAHCA